MSKQRQTHWIMSSTSSLMFLLIFIARCMSLTTDLLFPVSFSVVRHSSISANLTTYMKNIGYPSIDQNGNNIGYNVLSLDGFKTSSTYSSTTNDLSPLGTWVNINARILGNARNLFGKSSSQTQAYIVNQFHKRAAKVLLNAYSFQRPVSQKNVSAISQAQQITQFVVNNNFDGVSIDFDDFNSVKDKTASPWLTTLLKALRKKLGKEKLIVLQIYPTFIQEMPLFNNPLINSYVDLFVVKYYNLFSENYNSLETLFEKATVYNGTALWQLQKSPLIKMDVCKTVAAKPPVQSGTWNFESFMSASSLGSIFEQARTKYSWFGGYANLDLGSDPNGDFQLVALNSLRTYCNRYQTCFCS